MNDDPLLALQILQDPGNEKPESDISKQDPTRYGDWEKGGRCIDF